MHFYSMFDLQKYIKEFIDFAIRTGPKILVTLLIFTVLNLILKYLFKIFEKLIIKRLTFDTQEQEEELHKRATTLVSLLSKTTYTFLWALGCITILSQVGINIGPILATAGVLGLAVSFGAQNLIKDFISGLFIILENQIRLGDVAIINGTTGLVEAVNLRTTIIRDTAGVVHIFPNGSINTISNMTLGWSAAVFDINIAYKEDTDRVSEIMQSVLEEMRSEAAWGIHILNSLEIFGIDEFAASSVVIKARVKTKPMKQWDVAREYRRRIKKAFEQAAVEMPFPHTTVIFPESNLPFKRLGDKAPTTTLP